MKHVFILPIAVIVGFIVLNTSCSYGSGPKNRLGTDPRQTLNDWQPILDCHTGLALTATSSAIGSDLFTKPMTLPNNQPTDNQLWMMDSDGRVVNKESKLVIDGSGSKPVMHKPLPITSGKQWEVRTDIMSNQDPEQGTIPKIVEKGRQFCLNTGNRFSPEGALVVMYDPKKTNPGNACWNAGFETEKAGCPDGIVVRKNVASITGSEAEEYNKALKTIKEYSSTNQESFENVANYHGQPWMCNKGQSEVVINGNCPLPYGCPCCIKHQYIKQTEGFEELFTPWHRLFTRQMELSLNKAIPYWDWTSVGALPSLATASQGQWQDGPIKGAGGKTTTRDFQSLSPKDLAKEVKTAYTCKTTFEFNNQIVNPHNTVHNQIGGSMGSTAYAAYDPIFYLHHSEVDYQYAYWQELQNLRGIYVTFNMATWKMQPFAQQTSNVKFQNPYMMTREKSRAPDGVYYESQLCYKYDTLLFQGKTPKEFLKIIGQGNKQPSLYAGHTDKYVGISSNLYFSLDQVSRKIYEDIGPISSFGSGNMNQAQKNDNRFYPNEFLYDVTDILNNPSSDPLDKTLHFEVSRYEDIEGNQLPLGNTYKPTVIYKKANTDTHVIRLHVDNIERYSPNIIHCHLDSTVEFLNSDGSFSEGVTLVSNDPSKKRTIVEDFSINKLKNKFVIDQKQRLGESTTINVGYYPGCHLQCDSDGLPTSGHPDVIVVPWNLNWVKRHENMIEISSCVDATVIIAWCHTKETDIVEISNKKDFDDCTNLAHSSVDGNGSGGSVDGFIAIQHAQDSVGTFYFASQSLCKLGFKIAIKIQKCPPVI